MEQTARLAGQARPPMLQASFWRGTNQLVMRYGEINRYNQMLCQCAGCGRKYLADLPAQWDGEEIRAMVSYRTLPEECWDPLPSNADAFYSALLTNQNLSQIPRRVSAEYGVCAYPADLRTFPTSAACAQPSDPSLDLLQESCLTAGEEIIILHHSNDRRWLFVQAANDFGWVRASRVGRLSRGDFLRYARRREHHFITLLQPWHQNGELLSMGTRLPRSSRGEVLFPGRSRTGALTLIPGPLSAEHCTGSLPYTTANFFRQALRLVGTPYRWGGKNGGLDCSGAACAVYACFGITLPRNTCQMARITRHQYTPGRNPRADLAKLPPGTLLLMPGHVMLYLGSVGREPFVLQALTRCYDARGREQILFSTAVTSLSDLYHRSGQSFLQRVTQMIPVTT